MANLKSVAKVSPSNRPGVRNGRRFNSALFSEPAKVEVEKPGVRMFITDASLTIVEKENKDGEKYEKVYIHGFDAVGGLTINGLEFDGPRFTGTIPFFNGFKYHIRVSGYYTGSGDNKTFVKTGEYRHLGDGFEADSEEQFWADVEAAEARIRSGKTEAVPEIAV